MDFELQIIVSELWELFALILKVIVEVGLNFQKFQLKFQIVNIEEN